MLLILHAHLRAGPAAAARTLAEYRRVCAQGPRKMSNSDTLADEAPGDWSPSGSPSDLEPEFGRSWQEGALRAFPSVMDPTPEQEAPAPALTEVQWRPALESGAITSDHGWAGMFNPPPDSAGPGMAIPSYSPGSVCSGSLASL